MDISRKVMSRVKLRQLQLIVAIDDLNTLKNASERIGMSQPAATQTLRDLESLLDCELFTRTNRGVVSTKYGEALIKHARTILTQVRHAGEELSGLVAGSTGQVVVGTLLATSALILPKAIILMREINPNVIIKVIVGTNDVLMPLLLRGDIDIVLGLLPENNFRKGTKQIPLYSEDFIIFTSPSHPLSKKRQVHLRDLSFSDWVLPPIETTLRAKLEKEFFNAGLQPPNCTIESTSWLTNQYLWENTDLIGVAPEHIIKEKVTRGELVRLPIDLKFSLGSVGISISYENELSSVVKNFIDAVKSACQVPYD